MASAKDIKNRIRSIGNIIQITKAMEAVSATKMRRSQESALSARPYALSSFEMLKNLLKRSESLPLLFEDRKVKKSLLLVITADKGLAGAFNSNVLRQADAWILNKKESGAPFELATVGKKAKDYFEKRDANVIKSFWGFGDFSTFAETLPIVKEILDSFLARRFDEVEVVYTNFRSTLKQEASLRKILPVTEEGIEEMVTGMVPDRGRYSDTKEEIAKEHEIYNYEYKFEPNATDILNVLIPELLRMHIHHIILESNASEHSARMVAMKNATDNAGDLIGNLRLHYNKVRQAAITRELTEITAGAEALEN